MGKLRRIIKKVLFSIDVYNGAIRYVYGCFRKKELDKYDESKENVFLLMTPSYGNIGDLAITEATINFINDNFPDKNIVEIDFEDTIQSLSEIKRIIRPHDIVVLQGGGNFGTLYYDAEIARRYVIKKLSNNKIISMPQSFYYEDSIIGRIRMKKGISIYNKHKQLILAARDKNSFESMKKIYAKSDVILCPDIVFYLKKNDFWVNTSKTERINNMLCIRNDTESRFNKKIELLNYLSHKKENMIVSDTCVARRVYKSSRKYEIKSLINLYKEARVVMTDRLHGMIFAYLTDTPCLVFPSLDKKVYGAYEWIREETSIKFIDDFKVDDIDNYIEEVLNSKKDISNNYYFNASYDELKNKFFS